MVRYGWWKDTFFLDWFVKKIDESGFDECSRIAFEVACGGHTKVDELQRERWVAFFMWDEERDGDFFGFGVSDSLRIMEGTYTGPAYYTLNRDTNEWEVSPMPSHNKKAP